MSKRSKSYPIILSPSGLTRARLARLFFYLGFGAGEIAELTSLSVTKVLHQLRAWGLGFDSEEAAAAILFWRERAALELGFSDTERPSSVGTSSKLRPLATQWSTALTGTPWTTSVAPSRRTNLARPTSASSPDMRYVDPVERHIALALRPGRFVADRASVTFLCDLESVAATLRKLVDEGEAAPAASLYDTLLACLFEKIDPTNGFPEIDRDLVGRLGPYGVRVVRDWLHARHKAGASEGDTAAALVALIGRDEEGFTHDCIDELEDALLSALRDTLVALIADLEDSGERDRLAVALGRVYLAQGDAKAYLAHRGQEKLLPHECAAVARSYERKGDFATALEWVERGLAERRGSGIRHDASLEQIHRRLLVRHGRDKEAQESAWAAFQDWPSVSTYDELLSYAPEPERSTWRDRALDSVSKAELATRLALYHTAGAVGFVASSVDQASDTDLERVGSPELERLAPTLASDHPRAAAKLFRALGMKLLGQNRLGRDAETEALTHFANAEALFEADDATAEALDIGDELEKRHPEKREFIEAWRRSTRTDDVEFVDRALRTWTARVERVTRAASDARPGSAEIARVAKTGTVAPAATAPDLL